MNRTDEFSLAWALVKAATPFLSSEDFAWLCVKIGAGEAKSAIDDVLAALADNKVVLNPTFAPRLQAWVRGYAGSDAEPTLRRLIAITSSSVRPEGTVGFSRRGNRGC